MSSFDFDKELDKLASRIQNIEIGDGLHQRYADGVSCFNQETGQSFSHFSSNSTAHESDEPNGSKKNDNGSPPSTGKNGTSGANKSSESDNKDNAKS